MSHLCSSAEMTENEITDFDGLKKYAIGFIDLFQVIPYPNINEKSR